MDQPQLYDFRIDQWAPETLPMARLAEYLAQLANLFGQKDQVHFLKVNKGSAIPVIAVEQTANLKVMTRLRLVGTADAPEDLARTQQNLNRLLRDDNASAYLKARGGAKILEFKGAKTPLAEEVVLHEQGEFDGVVIKIGGKDDTVPLTIEGESGQFYRCNTKRDLARQLAGHIFGSTVRVSGRGKWRRSQDGDWELEIFDVQAFEVLSDTSLVDVVTDLRGVAGSDWNQLDAPQEELKKLRGN